MSSSTVVISPLASHRTQPPRMALVSVVAQPVVTPPEPPTPVEIQRLLTGVLEVLDHRRPATQLAGLLPSHVQRALLTKPRPTDQGPRRLRSVFLNRTTPEILDICARIEQMGRSQAMAGRLKANGDRWEFTLLSLI